MKFNVEFTCQAVNFSIIHVAGVLKFIHSGNVGLGGRKLQNNMDARPNKAYKDGLSNLLAFVWTGPLFSKS